MKNVISFKKHIESDKLKYLAQNIKELKEIEFLKENYEGQLNKYLALEFNLKIDKKWPPKFSEYIEWTEYEDIQEFVAKWLLRQVEDG